VFQLTCPECGHETTYVLSRLVPVETGGLPLSRQLRVLRDTKGLGQRELAGRIGMSQSKLSRIELGKQLPTVDEVTAWAEAVGAPENTEQLVATLTEAATYERVAARQSASRASGGPERIAR
jgi:transcriptional regulator with XRE-family HTH domain